MTNYCWKTAGRKTVLGQTVMRDCTFVPIVFGITYVGLNQLFMGLSTFVSGVEGTAPCVEVVIA